MRKINLLIASLALAPLGLAAAADFDGSKPMLCAAVNLQECVPGGGCESVTADSINAPDFLRIDGKKKTITAAMSNETRPATKIISSTKFDDKLVLQGADEGVEGVRDDGLAWSIAIDLETGKMVLTASGEEVAFVIFGSCAII